MVRRIPPLNPLHVFEVASRLGNFTKAADELNVTQSAVSRQIATLEGYLGVRLFRRERKGIVLTPEGARYGQEVTKSFERISAATLSILGDKNVRPLGVRVYNTFASKWLIPRLQRLYDANPDVLVRIETNTAPVDFNQDNVDVAVQFGDGTWPNLEVRLLFSDVIQPVCSPGLKAKIGDIADLGRVRLLHARYRRVDWHDWLASCGNDVQTGASMEFSSSLQTYQAAIEGLGVAMGQIRLLDSDVVSGALLPLFRPLERTSGYYLVWPKARPLSQKGRRFVSWLVKEAAPR